MANRKHKKRYWGIIAPNMPADGLAQMAKQQEDIGLEGTFAPQVYGPPFIPLAAAATTTVRLQLATGIALALTRSPFETATAAIDLDRMSNGRFILGLGTALRSWTEGFYGMPYGKPVAHLREVVEIIRMCIAKAHSGELTSFNGKYYDLDFSELQPPGPPLRTEIPIWISAVRGAMTRLGAEIADGVIGHPIWSPHWATTTIPEQLKIGLDRGGRQRSDIHVNYWFWVTPNKDRKQSVEDARAVVAFYAGIEQYEPYFAAHGFGDRCKGLQDGVKRGDFMSVAHLVSDDMATTFVMTGTPDEVRKKLEPMWEVADSMTLLPPVLSLEPENVLAYFDTIAETFYQDL